MQPEIWFDQTLPQGEKFSVTKTLPTPFPKCQSNLKKLQYTMRVFFCMSLHSKNKSLFLWSVLELGSKFLNPETCRNQQQIQNNPENVHTVIIQ